VIFHLRTADSKTTKKRFFDRIVTGDEKWIFYDNLKKKKYYAKWSIVAIDLNTMAEHLWFDHALYLVGPKGLIYYELLILGDSITGNGIGYN